MRLLVVEDEQRLAAGLRRKARGRRVRGRCRAQRHRGYLDGARNPFDAIILDVMLPGANGYQVCRTLRSEGN